MLRLCLQSTPLTPDEVLPELFLIKESAPKKLKMFVSHQHIEQTKAEKMKTNILKQ